MAAMCQSEFSPFYCSDIWRPSGISLRMRMPYY